MGYTKWERFKDWLKSVKRHKLLYSLLVVFGFIIYRMFISNYEFQQPVINKRSETYISVWNERAMCLTELDNIKQEQHQANLNAFDN